jgi:hypothetical protein
VVSVHSRLVSKCLDMLHKRAEASGGIAQLDRGRLKPGRIVSATSKFRQPKPRGDGHGVYSTSKARALPSVARTNNIHRHSRSRLGIGLGAGASTTSKLATLAFPGICMTMRASTGRTCLQTPCEGYNVFSRAYRKGPRLLLEHGADATAQGQRRGRGRSRRWVARNFGQSQCYGVEKREYSPRKK